MTYTTNTRPRPKNTSKTNGLEQQGGHRTGLLPDAERLSPALAGTQHFGVRSHLTIREINHERTCIFTIDSRYPSRLYQQWQAGNVG